MKIHLACCCLLLALTGCNAGAGGTAGADQFDLKLEKAETSAIPGASARVLAAPANPAAGAAARFCVTDAGFCPLSAATPAGENCICQAGNLMYGGTTGMQPHLNTATIP